MKITLAALVVAIAMAGAMNAGEPVRKCLGIASENQRYEIPLRSIEWIGKSGDEIQIATTNKVFSFIPSDGFDPFIEGLDAPSAYWSAIKGLLNGWYLPSKEKEESIMKLLSDPSTGKKEKQLLLPEYLALVVGEIYCGKVSVTPVRP